MFGLNFRELLPHSVVDEFDQLFPRLNRWALEEHHDDGTHGDVVADSLTLGGGLVGEFVQLPFAKSRYLGLGGGTWTVAEANQLVLGYARAKAIAMVAFTIRGTTIATATCQSLNISLPELQIFPFLADTSTQAFTECGTGHWFDAQHNTFGTFYMVALPGSWVKSGGGGAIRCTDLSAGGAAFPISNSLQIQATAWFVTTADNL